MLFMSIFFRNFAAMNANTKRKIASWILLAVFLPMLVFASLHVHGEAHYEDETCSACAHHQCDGHLSQYAGSYHECVLCHFLSLPMLAVAVATLAVCSTFCGKPIIVWHDDVCYASHTVVGLRAPPYVLRIVFFC